MNNVFQFLATAVTVCWLSSGANILAQDTRPNVVFFLADDMGLGDTSAYQDLTGNVNQYQIDTPNLEALAARGTRFTDAHSGAAVCTPTRVGLLTGTHSFRSILKSGVATGNDLEGSVFGGDHETILKNDFATLEKVDTVEVDLEAGNTYEVHIIYNGKQGCTIGWEAPGDLYVDSDTYLAAAKEADAVIYFAGLDHGHDREAEDRPDMKLPGAQDHAIAELASVNPNTIVFMIAGSAVEMPWIDDVHALFWGWYGGMFAGDVYADVLCGDVVPSGRMPMTLPIRLADNPHVELDDYNAACPTPISNSTIYVCPVIR